MLQFSDFEPTNQNEIMMISFAQQFPLVPFFMLIPQSKTIQLDNGCLYFRSGTTVYIYNGLTNTWKSQPSSMIGKLFNVLFSPEEEQSPQKIPSNMVVK